MRSLKATILSIFLCASCYAQNDDAIEQIRQSYTQISQNTRTFSSKEKDDNGNSTDGGKVTAYFQGKVIQLITGVYMGESGKQRIEYYFKDGKLIFAVNVDFTYNRPYSYDEKAAKKNQDTAWFDPRKTVMVIDRYYFDKDKLIQWISSGKNDHTFDVKKHEAKEKQLLSDATRLKKLFE